MPTYINDDGSKNPGREAKSWGGTAWRWGEERAVSFFVPDEIGLRKAGDEPRVRDACLYAGTVEIAEEPVRIYVPDCIEFLVGIVVTAGEIEVRRNYADAVPTPVCAGVGFRGAYRRADVESFCLSSEGGATAIVSIERAG